MSVYSLILPAVSSGPPSFVSDFAHHFIGGIRLHAEAILGQKANIILVDSTNRKLWELCDGAFVAADESDRGTARAFFNAAFFLSDEPLAKRLLEVAGDAGLGLCGSAASSDFYACAFGVRTINSELFWRSLTLVSACSNEDTIGTWGDLAPSGLVPAYPSGSHHSPAMEGVCGFRARSSNEAPRYWNTALREVLYDSTDRGAVNGHPERMAAALRAQRERSQVPWLFNSLLNEIEYRLGTEAPSSYPPEIHLSLTGRCNIECGFCGYSHQTARRGSVRVDELSRLKLLSQVATLRLNAGLGDPTLVPDMPAIITYLASVAPQLYTNFFTNGIALDRAGLMDALVGRIDHINVSMNAATRESWSAVSGGADYFDRLCGNLRRLQQAKRSARSANPLVFASIVLTAANVRDLPRLPSLCRDLGVDRLTGFPYFGMGLSPDRFDANMTLAACWDQYQEVYEEAVREAQSSRVSLELPDPWGRRQTSFGLEVRKFYDFAGIERNFWTVGRFLGMLRFEARQSYCHFLWRTASIANTDNSGHSPTETHYLYPCIGPLSGVDLSRDTAFHFEAGEELHRVLHGRMFRLLRRAQHEPGLSPVCDHCRNNDTRDPAGFVRLERLVAAFSEKHVTRPLVQIGKPMEKNPVNASGVRTYAAQFRNIDLPARLTPLMSVGASVMVVNDGALVWRRSDLAGKNVDLIVCWDGKVSATHHLPCDTVTPGQSVVFRFALSAPADSGTHEITLDLVHQNVARFSERGVTVARHAIEVERRRPTRSAALLHRAHAHAPWYYRPTQGILRTRKGEMFPHFVSKAQGCFLWDLEGRRYIDYTMGWGCALLGYAESRVQRAVKKALASAAIVPFPYELEIQVAEMLIEDIPCAEMVMFGKNGSDVCTLAARVARTYTGRKKILYCGYHGWQDWWVEQLGFGATGVPDRPEPLMHRFRYNDLEGFTRLINEHRFDLAAVMMEPAGPSQGWQGPSPDASAPFLSEVARLTHDAGGLLVFDEIITGFRYPGGGVQKATGVVPDLACFGKALSNGMPLSAFAGRAEILQRSMGRTNYGPTFRGELYSLAAAAAAMRIYREEPVADEVWACGRALQAGINASCVRNGVAAVCEGPPFRFTPAFAEEDLTRLAIKRALFQQEMLRAGVITYNGFLVPSYAHRAKGVIDNTLKAVDKVMAAIGSAEQSDQLELCLEIPFLKP